MFRINSSAAHQPSVLSSITHQDSPSPISSQNSTSGDDNGFYNRTQQQQLQQQKKKGIRNSIGRLFTRKLDIIDHKPIRESPHSSPYISHGK